MLVIIVFYIYYWKPAYGWLLGILFLLTYKFQKQIPTIKEMFAQKFSSPSQATEDELKSELMKELTKEESSVIQNILKKYKDDINFLLEDDLEAIKKYSCTTHPDGVGLPIPVKEYDINKTIDFDI